DSRAILLVAHYDSRPRTDLAFDTAFLEMPIDGANDGASGVAVLMELGNLMAEIRPPCNVEFLLTDAEDWGVSGDRDRYLLGSQHFGRSGIRDRYHFGIVLDMIGDAEQEICREAFSDSFFVEINDMIWEVAAELGVVTFIDSVRHGVLDDHLNLAAAGVPAVVVVDFDYPYWHTEYDTPDKCSPQALENVGVVMTRIVYSPSLWPGKK
ncbi:MAG: M28 family peptidase, partial [Candidatus Zixiibacteriota bacterium]